MYVLFDGDISKYSIWLNYREIGRKNDMFQVWTWTQNKDTCISYVDMNDDMW